MRHQCSERPLEGDKDGGGRGQYDRHGATTGAKRNTGGHVDPDIRHVNAGKEGEWGCNSTGPRRDLDVDPAHFLLCNGMI